MRYLSLAMRCASLCMHLPMPTCAQDSRPAASRHPLSCCCLHITQLSTHVQVGSILGSLVSHGAVSLDWAAEAMRKAVPEDAPEEEGLVESDLAGSVIASLLSSWAQAHSPDRPAAAWRRSNLKLSSFLPKVRCKLTLALVNSQKLHVKYIDTCCCGNMLVGHCCCLSWETRHGRCQAVSPALAVRVEGLG